MTKKIIPIGGSEGVIIPKETLRALGAKKGTLVQMQTDFEKREIVIRINSRAPQIIDPEIYRVGRRLLEQYRPAFEALARQ